ncbi:MAG: hypothetical protein NVSMB65_19510 [Chloroflexota bacterium]
MQRQGRIMRAAVHEGGTGRRTATEIQADTDLKGGSGVDGRGAATAGPVGGEDVGQDECGTLEHHHGGEALE